MLDPMRVRLENYLKFHGLSVAGVLGQGKDGCVWLTSRSSAVKIHERPESYRAERNAYIRLRELQVRDVAGFHVPFLHNYVDDLLALEMTVVSPPYVLDFASAKIDSAHDLIEDEGHTLADLIHERFEDRADEVIALVDELGSYAGVYLTDVHAHNIKFAPAR